MSETLTKTTDIWIVSYNFPGEPAMYSGFTSKADAERFCDGIAGAKLSVHGVHLYRKVEPLSSNPDARA